jgi:hypothetical protein
VKIRNGVTPIIEDLDMTANPSNQLRNQGQSPAKRAADPQSPRRLRHPDSIPLAEHEKARPNRAKEQKAVRHDSVLAQYGEKRPRAKSKGDCPCGQLSADLPHDLDRD